MAMMNPLCGTGGSFRNKVEERGGQRSRFSKWTQGKASLPSPLAKGTCAPFSGKLPQELISQHSSFFWRGVQSAAAKSPSRAKRLLQTRCWSGGCLTEQGLLLLGCILLPPPQPPNRGTTARCGTWHTGLARHSPARHPRAGTAQHGAEQHPGLHRSPRCPPALPGATRGPHWDLPCSSQRCDRAPLGTSSFLCTHPPTLHRDACNILSYSTKVCKALLRTHPPLLTQRASSSLSPPGLQGPLTLCHSSCPCFSTHIQALSHYLRVQAEPLNPQRG